MRNRLPLHKRIPFKLACVLSSLVFAIIITSEILSYHYVKADVLGKIQNDQILEAKYIAHDIDVKLKARIKFLNFLASSLTPQQLANPELLQKELRQYSSLTNFFKQGITVLRADGSGLIAEFPIMPGRNKLTFYDSEWFLRTQEETGVIISSPFRGRDSGSPIIAMAAAIRDKNGQLIGILATPILLNDPDFLGYAYDQHRQFSDVLIISRADEIFVAANNKNMVLKPTPARGVNKLHDKVMDGFNGVGTTINAFGVEDISAISDVSITNWFVVVRTPSKIAFAPLRDRLQANVAIAFLIVFITSSTIFLVLHTYFLPLENAAREVRIMSTDGLKSLPQKRNDEIGDLIRGFNYLVETVTEKTEDLELVNTKLEKLSQTDGLTKVFNRRYFDKSLEQSWRTHRRSGHPLSLIMLDIDFFKKYNDVYGHLQGDECLKIIAESLNATLKRPTDIFARYGGEEFAAIIANDEEGVKQVAETMRRTIENLKLTHKDSPHEIVTISLGVTTIIPENDTPPEILILQADEALYKSKENGRNRVEVFNNERNA
ncbi:diguanylate cyclase [Desulfovibrio sp. JC022]|uniref:sensor domain-containing diguanylate cyclase n=1 Tax=Desulfovibrio sp. JC022 TaxID=2593642 RepID=UPI0013D0F7C7|nr:diguanylate cyclase [Desulfovibrio sp. JC022]NDV21882.1 diguanylate cyclase [Desulfovibrio sp. JC022]